MPSLLTNVWQATGPVLVPLVRRLWPMLLGICLGTWLGGGLLTADDGTRASVGLGRCSRSTALLGLTSVEFFLPRVARAVAVAADRRGDRPRDRGHRRVHDPVRSLPAGDRTRRSDELVQALGLSFTVSTLALAATLVQVGALQTSVAGASLLALAPALIGMALGQWVRALCVPRPSASVFFAGSLLLGAHLVLRPWI